MIEVRVIGTQKEIDEVLDQLKKTDLNIVEDNEKNYKNRNSELYRRYIKIEKRGEINVYNNDQKDR